MSIGAVPLDTKLVDNVALLLDGKFPRSVASATTLIVATEADKLAEVDNPTVVNFGVNVYVLFENDMTARGNPYTLPSMVFRASASSAVPRPAKNNPASGRDWKSAREFFIVATNEVAVEET